MLPLRLGHKVLMQPRILGFGLLQDGNVGVGIFPEVLGSN